MGGLGGCPKQESSVERCAVLRCRCYALLCTTGEANCYVNSGLFFRRVPAPSSWLFPLVAWGAGSLARAVRFPSSRRSVTVLRRRRRPPRRYCPPVTAGVSTRDGTRAGGWGGSRDLSARGETYAGAGMHLPKTKRPASQSARSFLSTEALAANRVTNTLSTVTFASQ